MEDLDKLEYPILKSFYFYGERIESVLIFVNTGGNFADFFYSLVIRFVITSRRNV